jgi:hypothetical protein
MAEEGITLGPVHVNGVDLSVRIEGATPRATGLAILRDLILCEALVRRATLGLLAYVVCGAFEALWRLRRWRGCAAILLAWWFAAYPLEFATTTAAPRLHGPYPTLWACLRGVVDLEMAGRFDWAPRARLMPTECFPAPDE